MIVKRGSKPVVRRKWRLSTAKTNPEILELRAFLKNKPVGRKSVVIKIKSVFILWGTNMYEEESKSTTYSDGRIEVYKKEIRHDNGLTTFFLAVIAISLSITTSWLIFSGARNNNEAKDSRGGTVTVQESPSYMRTNQGSGN
jgi:hypothetical protein